MTSGTALRASLTIPGQAEHVKDARRFVVRTMGAGHPSIDLAVLLASELVTNSIRYSDSGLPGGTITVTVTSSTTSWFRMEVLDAGGASVPHVEAVADALAEGGQGLRLVSELSAIWGYRREAAGVATWFEVGAEPGPATESHPSTIAPKQAAGPVTRPRTLTSCEGARP
jgi:anti-sigma regulatory factor (Ser/Thr protein kinase)